MRSPNILKRMEAAWKRFFMRSAARLMPSPRRAGPPDWDARPYRVLYLRYGRIGDMIISTGVLRAIATSHRGITLDVLASPANASVLEGNPHVARVLTFRRRRWTSFPAMLVALRRGRYDVVIDPMVLKPSVTTLLLMMATGAPYRIGIGGRANDFIYTLPVSPRAPSAHHADQEAVAVIPFGLDVGATDVRAELFLTPTERAEAERLWTLGADAASPAQRLLVNVSASLAHRHWPDERYVATLRHVVQGAPHWTVLVIGSPEDAARVQRIVTAAGAQPVQTPTLREALALVGTADVVFTPDTSIAHAAAAFRKPAVVMLVAGSGMFAPYGNTGRDLYSAGPALESLPVGAATDALDALLESSVPTTRTDGVRATPRLSAFLIVHNEAEHLADCLASIAGLADEIVVLDDGSTDATTEIARRAGARVEHRPFDDFGHQKQAALEMTTGEWVFSIDADERVTPALKLELESLLTSSPTANGFWIRREILYLGARLRYGGAGSDWVLRVARRGAARFELLPVHEHLLVDGETARVRGTLDHLKYRSLDEHVARINRYTDMAAARKRDAGRPFHAWHLLRIPWELWSGLIFRLGILDGRPGIIWAAMTAFYSFLKYAKLWRGEESR